EFEEDKYRKHNSYIMTHFFKRTIAGDELKQLKEEKESLFREIYKQQIDQIPNYIRFLDDLNSKGCKIAEATSSPQANLNILVHKLQIGAKMESMLVSENVSQHKPHPEVYLKSADNLGIAPNACVVFEDSFSGVTAARNAGMNVVGVLSSHQKEDLPPCSLYIHDYSEIDADRVLALLKS